VQSSSQIITTNKPTPGFSRLDMPFLSPNQQRQLEHEENVIHCRALCNVVRCTHKSVK